MKHVDRSYSKYESICTYQDRGKMKWNPFTTAELAGAHRNYRSDFFFDEPSFSLEQEEICAMLSFAKSHQLDISIEIQKGKKTEKIKGKVLDWKGTSGIIFKKTDGHYTEISFDEIVYLSDEHYFESFINQE